MSLFDLAFLLSFFKLSAGSGFWNNLQIADKKLYQQTISTVALICHKTFTLLLVLCKNFFQISVFASNKIISDSSH